MNILVTGGAGYIGSHTCVELLEAGHDVVVIDSLCNSHQDALWRVQRITGKSVTFYQGDIRCYQDLDALFSQHRIDAVIHFAGLKAVGESSQDPLRYYDVNVSGSMVLIKVMEAHQCHRLVFSSSATVYGAAASVPYVESMPVAAGNVYGRTKQMVENILQDHCGKPESAWHVTVLRYFNPIGAHHSGLIGEDPQGIPDNLLPYISQVAVGRLEALSVFGDDYATPDGTGIRDYIHVVDLAHGHVKALEAMMQTDMGCRVYNLGAGRGYSVLEVIAAFENVCGKPIPYRIAPRRHGDLAEYYADASLAWQALGWKTQRDLITMVEDAWRWQSNNPSGYANP